ncbi:MAG: response regulator transcription factor [Anaerolineae bacterium]|nr:response regulator transcription factor [Thermoflexales bacterium]MDW8406912.1 response regulator transcription factor [Anaerolineae bacterium]
MAIRILLAEDHKIVREGTRQLLEQSDDLVVIAEAATGEAAVELCEQLKPDVVVMDVHLPGINGIEATRVIRLRLPSIRVVVLSAYDDDRYVFPLLQAGANGYLLKTTSGDNLAEAIRSVFKGETVLDPQISSKVVGRLAQIRFHRSGGPSESLTERELDVLRAVSRGMSNKEIGESLGISTNTVQVHLRNIFAKLGVGDRTEAVAYAIRQGWIVLEQ